MIDARRPYFEQMARLVDLERLRASGLRVVHDALYGAGMGYFGELLGGGVRALRGEVNPAFPGIHAPEPIPPNTDLLVETVRAGGYSRF